MQARAHIRAHAHAHTHTHILARAQLMLLTDGYVLYYGHALATTRWLDLCGHPVPYGVSVPDHLLDLACGEVPGVAPEHSAAAKQALLDKFTYRKLGVCHMEEMSMQRGMRSWLDR